MCIKINNISDIRGNYMLPVHPSTQVSTHAVDVNSHYIKTYSKKSMRPPIVIKLLPQEQHYYNTIITISYSLSFLLLYFYYIMTGHIYKSIGYKGGYSEEFCVHSASTQKCGAWTVVRLCFKIGDFLSTHVKNAWT